MCLFFHYSEHNSHCFINEKLNCIFTLNEQKKLKLAFSAARKICYDKNLQILHFLKETFMLKMCIMLQSEYRTTKICLTDHMPLISRVINKLLESHSMPLLNHYFITFNELMFF